MNILTPDTTEFQESDSQITWCQFDDGTTVSVGVRMAETGPRTLVTVLDNDAECSIIREPGYDRHPSRRRAVTASLDFLRQTGHLPLAIQED